MDLKLPFTPKLMIAGVCAGLVLAGGLTAYRWNDQRHETALTTQDSSVVASYTSALANLGFAQPKTNQHIKSATDSGAYLSSLFAQRHHNWKQAARYLEEIRKPSDASEDLLKKSIVFKIGAGDITGAVADAKTFLDEGHDDNGSQALASLLLLTDALSKDDYKTARELLKTMPDDGLTLFMKPIFQGWLKAEQGQLDKTMLAGHSMHIYSAATIANYLDKPKQFVQIANQIAQFDDLNATEQEQLADMYMAAGQHKKAKALYTHLLQAFPLSERLQYKAESNKFHTAYSLYMRPQSLQEGVALAVYDMAQLLYQDQSFDSAYIFVNIAQHLHADLPQISMLKAGIAAQLKDYPTALKAYGAVPALSPYYNDAQLQAAEVYEQSGDFNKAMSLLKQFYEQSHNVRALILSGDMYRRHEQFSKALNIYDKVINDHLDGKITQPFWHLHYARGMVLEQMGRWPEAKSELTKALALYPNHPFILNYLGYAMVDRNEDLDQAMAMLEQALSMQPNDAYITDSLGWAYYKAGKYDKAAKYLERAVSLMPGDAVVNDHLGDAYWQVGRKIEARYQWKRAKLDQDISADLLANIDEKLDGGLRGNTALILSAGNEHTGAASTPQ